MEPTYTREYHYQDGLHFCRTPEGIVVIHKNGLPIATIDAASWASIVAGMSASGESSASYYACLDGHMNGYQSTDEQRRRYGVNLKGLGDVGL